MDIFKFSNFLILFEAAEDPFPEKNEDVLPDRLTRHLKCIQEKVVVRECKFRSMSIGKEEYETLHDRGRLVAPWRVTHYFLFSLGGFTSWVREKAGEDSGGLI